MTPGEAEWPLAPDGPAAWADDALPDEASALALVDASRHDAARALAVWRMLDGRIVRGGHAAWGDRVLGQVLAEIEGDEAQWVGVRSAYLTTWAECRQRDRGVPSRTDAWSRAWSGVQGLDPSSGAPSLMVRIASGAILQALQAPDREQSLDMWIGRAYAVLAEPTARLDAPAQIAPVIAAVLACVDAIERHPDPFVPANPWLERLAMRAARVPRGPERALALACVGRLARQRQDVDLARRHFDQACHVLLHAPERDLVGCLHWPRGIYVPCSVLLEVVRGVSGLEPVAQTVRRLDAMPPLARTLAANRLEAIRIMLGAATRPRLTAPPPSSGAVRVLDHDLAAASSAAHLQVLPHAAARALDAIDAGHAAAGLAGLERLTSALDTCGNAAVCAAVREAHLGVATRLRLPLAAVAAETRPEASAERGQGDEAASPRLPKATRAVRHAYWRTRHAFDEPSRLALAAWGRAYLLASGPDGEGEWARASVALDLVECGRLGIGVEIGSSGLVAPIAEDWWMRHPAVPHLALRLWVRAFALEVARTAPAPPLVSCLGVRRAADVAEDEAALLALRLPDAALRLLCIASRWHQEARDPAGLWRTAILQAMTGIRAGAAALDVDLRAVEEAHDGFATALSRAEADPLPAWSAVTTRPLAELIPMCGPAWVPWLQRALAVHRWCAHDARPEDVFGQGRGLPIELRAWPRQAGA